MCKRRERESEKNPLLKKIKIETGNLQLTFVGEKLENKKKKKGFLYWLNNLKVSFIDVCLFLSILNSAISEKQLFCQFYRNSLLNYMI